jgi:hypothetical protein
MLETAIGLIEMCVTATKIPHSYLEWGIDRTSEESQQIFALPQVISDRTAPERRRNKED